MRDDAMTDAALEELAAYGPDLRNGLTSHAPMAVAPLARLGYAWIPPELREGGGELGAARDGSLPKLIELGDLRGDLHCHTTLSDGRQTLDQMGDEAVRGGGGDRGGPHPS